jgi:arabinogalactan endo-1,4-beta-galactosidase
MDSIKTFSSSLIFCALLLVLCCSSDEPKPVVIDPDEEGSEFYFGADLSYVNQILDRGGVYKENSQEKDPYQIFADNGTTLARFRLWHNPVWTKEVYGASGTQMYNDLQDVKRSFSLARAKGIKILLDFHYSDEWADPGKQFIPAAWQQIKSIDVLRDSVYNYTFKTLQYLNAQGLMPDLVQVGNETNCGMLFSEAPAGFPACNVCDGQWQNAGIAFNAGIKAVRDVAATSSVKTKVMLHVADPKNVDWWFDGMKSNGKVTDFDMIGFSYYPLWHTTVPLEDISTKVSGFKSKYEKEVIILETAYPWTTSAEDGYNNHFGDKQPLAGYPFSEEGQYEFLKKLTQEVKEGKGSGLIYWEPAWISANMKDMWGTGSSWENCAFFNFDGNKITGMDYMKFNY